MFTRIHVANHQRHRTTSLLNPRLAPAAPIALLVCSLVFVLTGCDLPSSPSSVAPVPGTSSAASDASTAKSGSNLRSLLRGNGTPIAASEQKRWIAERHQPRVRPADGRASRALQTPARDRVLAASPADVVYTLATPHQRRSTQEATTGAFERAPLTVGISDPIDLPPPAATGSTGDIGTQEICLNATEISTQCQIMPDPIDGGGGGGGGGTTNPPDLLGTSSLRFDTNLREGYVTRDVLTETVDDRYVDEIRASSTTTITTNNGNYTETSPRYTFTRTNFYRAQAVSMSYHYAGTVDYDLSGEHFVEDNSLTRTSTSGAGAVTTFSSSSCAPFPVDGDDGPTISQTGRVSFEWQTICPHKNKQLQIRRVSGPGGGESSALVETGGDGWSIDAFEAWRGIFLNDGTYEWTIRASGESATRKGTFSISGGSLCRPDMTVTNFLAPGPLSNGGVAVSLPGCIPSGNYQFRAFGTNVNGTRQQIANQRVQANAGAGSATISLNAGQYANIRLVLYRVSDYNGEARVDAVSLN